eukprot:TRINITY_DN1780_c0_g1_i10.p1 TRINITY_DN1780_c0_g1~~TRINITY_DN1780_c0_g1_i10.p1  ORF type:complete len:449 (+),score=36.47 TRINITY_DN1780_c0_g1_i10:37-1347(+)
MFGVTQKSMPNPYPDYTPAQQFDEDKIKIRVKEELVKCLAILNEESPFSSQVTYYSNGKAEVDLTMYTGSFGNVYVQWRVYEYYKSIKNTESAKQHLNNALTAFKVNETLLEKEKPQSYPSFFMGGAGLYTLGAILYKEQGNFEEGLKLYQHVLAALDLCKADNVQDNIRFGRAGYLYCLLLLYKTDPKLFDCVKEIKEVTDLMKVSKEVRAYLKEKGYYGAGRGAYGIFYIMMKAVELVPKLTEDKELMELLSGTSKVLMKLQYPTTGNFPNVENEKEQDQLVQFCRGGPGAIPMLLQAHKIFNNSEFLAAAAKAGEYVWKNGILLKGNGLCHGITGNAYFLNLLYQYTSDDKWRYRTYMFVDATWNIKIQNITHKFKDPGRLTVGTPDTPYSLMEGLGGTVVFYADFLSGSMLFPGYLLQIDLMDYNAGTKNRN